MTRRLLGSTSWPNLLSEILTFFERLGVCVAIGVGAGAMGKYSSIITPDAPVLPKILGLFFLIVSIVLSVWIASDSLQRVAIERIHALIQYPVAVLIVISAIIFVLAGIYGGVRAF